MSKFKYEGYFDKPEEQALATAMVNDDIATIKGLIAKGVSLDCVGKYETTPIRMAIRLENPELLAKILELGADPNFKTSKKVVAAKFAVEHNDTTYTKILLKAGLDLSLIHI